MSPQVLSRSVLLQYRSRWCFILKLLISPSKIKSYDILSLHHYNLDHRVQKKLLVKNEKLDYHERKVFFIMSLFKISFFHFQELTMGFGQGPGDVSAVASSRLGSCSLKDQSIADAEWYWGEINREEVRHLYFPK